MPRVIVFGGCNGAGKSTHAPVILTARCPAAPFINADVIARGLSAGEPDVAAVAAGRIMLTQITDCVTRRIDFAFETTLAAKTDARQIVRWQDAGYRFELYYYWLPCADLAVSRVAARVRNGRHHIPESTVRQRYARSLANFFQLYRPLADQWEVADNRNVGQSKLLASGGIHHTEIVDERGWQQFCAEIPE